MSNVEQNLREQLIAERQRSGDTLLALNDKQKELVKEQEANAALRVRLADQALLRQEVTRSQASQHILAQENETLRQNNKAYKRFNWAMCIVLMISIALDVLEVIWVK